MWGRIVQRSRSGATIVWPAALSSGLTTPSMVYSVPMVLFGLWLIWNARRRRPVPA